MTPPSQKKGQPLMAAMRNAQFIAFAPLLFQAARVLRDRGFFKVLSERSPQGATIAELEQATRTSKYGVTVLLEAGLAAGLVEKEGDVWRPTRTGLLIERDPLTRANMNFVQDVCYRAADSLGDSIEQGSPVGLKELGDWPTLYEGLAALKEPARQSWLDFDHFYSDDSFPLLMHKVFESKPRKILDVGGNTGKFALQVLRHDPDVRITVADLPGQIRSCQNTLQSAGFADRADFHAFSILDADAFLPEGQDVIWMSQFLSCFSEDEMVHVMTVARRALGPRSRLLILDNYWDRQPNEVGAFCLQAISLYFTCVATGTSRMYDSKTVLDCIKQAGLVVESETDHIGWGHTLIECRAPHH